MQVSSASGVTSRHRPIESCDRRIAQHRAYKIVSFFFGAPVRFCPVAFGKQHWNSGVWKRVGELLAALQRFFELKQWETRVYREECSFGIRGDQRRIVLSAVRARSIPEDVQQR